MKKIRLSDMKWLVLLLTCLPLISSCSKADLPAYGEADITKVGAYHRFVTDVKDGLTGEFVVAEKELPGEYKIDLTQGIATVTFSIPEASGAFTEAERTKVNLSKMVVYVKVSTAARVTPMGDSPKLGAPGDWTKEHQYSIMAADGTKKTWTVKVALSR